MASRPAHIYSSTLTRRDKRWRSRRRRVFALGSVSRVGTFIAAGGVTALVAAERLVA